MSCWRPNYLGCLRVEQAHCPVLATRGQDLAVRRKGQGDSLKKIIVRGFTDFLAGGDVTDPLPPVREGEGFAIRPKYDRSDFTSLSVNSSYFLACCDLPKENGPF